MRYFAYGSNMDASRIESRIGWLPPHRLAKLGGYALCFNKIALRNPDQEGFANIVPQPDGVVWGVLYEDLGQEDIAKLDQYEGHPEHYRRETIEVELDGGTRLAALTYIAQPAMIREGLMPSRQYLQYLLNACEPLPAEYMAQLRATPTID